MSLEKGERKGQSIDVASRAFFIANNSPEPPDPSGDIAATPRAILSIIVNLRPS